MRTFSWCWALAAFAGAYLFGVGSPQARAAEAPIVLRLDAPEQNVVFTREKIPVKPGKLVLYYPEWIPGQHQRS